MTISDEILQKYLDIFEKYELKELAIKDGNFELKLKKDYPEETNPQWMNQIMQLLASKESISQPSSSTSSTPQGASRGMVAKSNIPRVKPKATQSVAPSKTEDKKVSEAKKEPISSSSGEFIQVSPITGTFYRSPAPDAEPFVKEGDKVEISSTLCIIESMKMMNEIKAERKGTIVKILVENETSVLPEDPLFIIKLD
jgi:acetyl-CoA carboxylase biotin carboxyl carrier protein